MSSQFCGGDGVVVSSPKEPPEYPPQKTTLNLQDAPWVKVVLCAVVLTAPLLDVAGVLCTGSDEFTSAAVVEVVSPAASEVDGGVVDTCCVGSGEDTSMAVVDKSS